MQGIYTSIMKRLGQFIAPYVETNDRMNDIGHYDSLTGLLNRKILVDIFNTSKKLFKKEERVIFIINIDRLDSINELYGREIGDEVIVKLTNRLQQLFKEENTVFREDHFYVCLDGVSEEDLERTGKEVLNLISKPLEIDRRKFHITVSIGISHYPSTGENIVMLLQQAEIAMSKVKKDGKNNFVIILPEDIIEIERKRKLEFDLKDILNRDELCLAYQPKVYLKTGEIKAMDEIILC